jgi:hypothetical protein
MHSDATEDGRMVACKEDREAISSYVSADPLERPRFAGVDWTISPASQPGRHQVCVVSGQECGNILRIKAEYTGCGSQQLRGGCIEHLGPDRSKFIQISNSLQNQGIEPLAEPPADDQACAQALFCG